MRNNAAYLPESPIVYIILPKSIRNRASFAIFVRRARCAVKNQINTMMKKILFLMAATAMMWGGVMQ